MSTLILALVTGAVVGLAMGALGGGGGVLAVPALVYLLGVAPADAGTASLVIVTATSLTALARHAGSGQVRWNVGLLFAAAGVPPAVAASVLAPRLPHELLTAAFAVLAATAAGLMLRGSCQAAEEPAERSAEPATAPPAAGPVGGPTTEEHGNGGARAFTDGARNPAGPGPGEPAADAAGVAAASRTRRSRRLAGRTGAGTRTAAAGAGLGAVTGLLGVGGGFFAVPSLVTVLKLPMRAAVATSLVVIVVNSLASLGTRLTSGGATLDPAILGPFIGAAVLGAWDGKRLASRMSGAALQRAFAALLLAMAVLMLADVVV